MKVKQTKSEGNMVLTEAVKILAGNQEDKEHQKKDLITVGYA